MQNPLPPTRPGVVRNRPFRIVALYALFGALWILLSDKLLGLLAHDRGMLTQFSVYKGWVFVGVTSWLMYRLIIRDYRKLQTAGALLEESEQRYRTLFEKTPAVILLVDPGTAEIVTANSAAASFYGYPREVLVGMKTTEINILPPEQVFKNMEEAQAGPRHVERRHRLKSGEVRDVEVYRGPVVIENRSYLFAIVHDITDRKKIEEQLRDNENKLRAITDAVADSIILIDDDMKITYWNDAAEKMFGRTRAEVMGKKIDFIVPDRFRDAHRDGYYRFVTSPEDVRSRKVHEVSALRVDGTEFPVELSHAGVRLMEKWHLAVVIRDISERKNLEGQLRHAQKMEAIGTLTGGIAHDFNNALTGIIGFASLVRASVSDDTLLSYVDNVLAAADRAADLTRSLLTFSSNKPIEPKQIDLNEVVARAEKLLSSLLREDISFRVEMSGEPVVVMADPGQIVQLLMNLAVNAEAAMPQGGKVLITLSLQMLEQEFVRVHGYGNPGRYGLVTFTDSGFGMDEETRVRIFDPFFTTKGVGKGTGLGLSAVYGIVKQHGGYINCYSEPGRGTTFRIYLPMMEPVPVEAPAQDPGRTGVRGGTETVLLAEDNMLVRGLIVDLLGQSGYKVIEAVDGEDAVARFREEAESIRLLVLDVIMPKKNGRQVYDEIRTINPDVKAIFTSGYPAEVFKGTEFDDPAISFVSKPVTPSALLGKMRELLEG